MRSIVIAGLVGLVVAGCGSSGGRLERRSPTKSASALPLQARRVSATPGSPSPALIGLRRGLASELRAAGPGTGAAVYDLTADRQLFLLRATAARPPASVEKLYTSVAVLTELGPGTRLQTTVLGAGHLAHGVWDGDLHLRGGGDPTFGDGTFNHVWEQGYGPTPQQLVAQLRQLGIRRVSGAVVGDDSLFDGRRGGPNRDFAPDIPDLGGQLAGLTYDHGSTRRNLSPGAFAARELVRTMRRAGIRAHAAKFTAPAPAGSRGLATVDSPPMSVLVRLMDVPSDDFFAEMLAKQLGARFGGAGSTAAGATVIRSVIAGLGMHPTIVDGSGLSRRDRSSPQQVVGLLRAVWRKPVGQEMHASLPVVGVNGTARRIGMRTAAQGRCVAKTGTLNYVTNLAGYCGAHDGHVLAFTLFLDGPTNTRGFALLGRMAATIARY